MESSVEALKMAFAVIVFVMALSLSIGIFSQARSTSEIVLQSSDQTQYYEYIEASDIDSAGNRIIGFETIIPTIYKYDKERYKIIFKQGTLNDDGSVDITGNLPVYQTTTNRNNWSINYRNDFNEAGTSNNICSFDIVEETQRNEPWVGTSQEIRKHLDAIFSGGIYYLPQYGTNINHVIDYGQYPNNKLYSIRNKKFVELIGKIRTTEETTDETTGITGNRTTTKTIITYVLIN